jgi:two-component system nitrate/nitrite sensor histidine kinase NarX
MLQWMRSSLPARAGLAVILIAVLALSSAISAGLLAWVSEDDAAAINTAGSLRMATYRLNWKLESGASAQEIATLQADMLTRLRSTDLHVILNGKPDEPLQQAYNQLLDTWQVQLQPALERGDKLFFQQQADSFVAQLEHFVTLLQHQSERRQGWQQNIQGAALLLTVFILVISMYQLQNSVITPLQDLVSATERFRAGDLHARIEYRSEDELGQMALSFNAMADSIEESHRTLETRVREKTQNLAQSNAALELLYLSSRSFSSQPASAEQLDQLINSFQKHLPGLRLSLCLHGNPLEPGEQLIAMHGSAVREICSRNDCASCERNNLPSLQSFPITSQGLNLGDLRAHFQDGHAPAQWEGELIGALTNLIGTALSLERQREQDNRMLLLDERTTIARELHDSLAQALSYMKLQVSRLQTLIRRGENAEQLELVSEEIREGLNSAYRQLRELLTTFRLQIPDGGLEQALDETAREFATRGSFHVQLNCASLPFSLSANEQIHLLQIAREALSNCARHAQASQAWISLRQAHNEIELLIEDDGCGITEGFDSRQHHGLTIMQERARSLHGQLKIAPREGGGTRIELNFQPVFFRQQSDKESA